MGAVRHTKNITVPDNPPSGGAGSTDWNADHTVTLTYTDVGAASSAHTHVGGGAPLGVNIAEAAGVDVTGVSESSSGITTAIGTSTTPKVIYFPPGTYKMKSISLPSNTIVIAYGAKFIAPSASAGTYFFSFSGKENVKIFGGEYDGRLTGTPTMGGISASGSGSHVHIVETYIHDIGNPAIMLVNMSYCTIEKNRMYNCTKDRNGTITISDAVAHIHILDNEIDTSYNDGILVYQSDLATQPSDIYIDHNVIRNSCTIGQSTQYQGRAAIHMYRSKDCYVTNNEVWTTFGDNEAIRFRNTRNFVCTGNHVSESMAGVACVRITSASSGETETDVGHGTIMNNVIVKCLVGIRYAYNGGSPLTLPIVQGGNVILGWSQKTAVGGYVGISAAATEILATGSVALGNITNSVS